MLRTCHYLLVPLVLIGAACRNSTSITEARPTPGLQMFVELQPPLAPHFEQLLLNPDRYFMPDVMGSGAAMFDFDNDEDLDILIASGKSIDDRSRAGGLFLFRQDPGGKFIDVTQNALAGATGYFVGVAVGDVDNDGDKDFYVTAYGPDQLWLNRGDGTFEEITKSAGIANPSWGTAASFFDYDQDGWLDLFVANYVDYYSGHRCEDGGGRLEFCGPTGFTGAVDKLFHNLGRTPDGVRFKDVTVEAGLTTYGGRGLGLICQDFNEDNKPDVFVANDMEANQLWIQQANHEFIDEAAIRGVAVNALGHSESNMGVVFDDLDSDSHFDVFVTHLRGETNTLFRGLGNGVFADGTAASGLGPPSLPVTGFGTAAIDLEHDGDLDLLVVNGAIKRGPDSRVTTGKKFWDVYAEPNQIFLNDGQGKFQELKSGGGMFCERREVSRALVYGDVDSDGDLGVLLTNCGGPTRLYRNDFPKQGNWLLIRAINPQWTRDDIGAVVTVRAGTRSLRRVVNPSSSYLSSHDIQLHFGLGAVDQISEIMVTWSDGSRERFACGEVNRSVKLVRGEGEKL